MVQIICGLTAEDAGTNSICQLIVWFFSAFSEQTQVLVSAYFGICLWSVQFAHFIVYFHIQSGLQMWVSVDERVGLCCCWSEKWCVICNFLKLCPDGPVCALTLKYLDFTVQLFSLVLNYPKSAPEPGTKPTVAPIRCPRDQCCRTVSGCLGLLASFHVSGLSPSGCCCFNSAKVQNSILKKTSYIYIYI